LAAAFYSFVGFLLLIFPLHGALALTLLLAVMFAIAGAFKIALALHIRPYSQFNMNTNHKNNSLQLSFV